MSSKCLSELAESLQGFTKSKIKDMLKISAFYLEKQKSFIPKKNFFNQLSISNKKALIIPPFNLHPD